MFRKSYMVNLRRAFEQLELRIGRMFMVCYDYRDTGRNTVF